MPSNQRYCCVCKNFSGKIVDGIRVSMHRFLAEVKVRKIWIQRCKNTRQNFVFANSDQTRLCSFHYVDKNGPTKENPLPVAFPKAGGSEKIHVLSVSSLHSQLFIRYLVRMAQTTSKDIIYMFMYNGPNKIVL